MLCWDRLSQETKPRPEEEEKEEEEEESFILSSWGQTGNEFRLTPAPPTDAKKAEVPLLLLQSEEEEEALWSRLTRNKRNKTRGFYRARRGLNLDYRLMNKHLI
jgi:hypothetical protein